MPLSAFRPLATDPGPFSLPTEPGPFYYLAPGSYPLRPPPPVDDISRLGAEIDGLCRDTIRIHDQVRRLRRDLRRAMVEIRDVLADDSTFSSSPSHEGDGVHTWDQPHPDSDVVAESSTRLPPDYDDALASGTAGPTAAVTEAEVEKQGLGALSLLWSVDAATLPFPLGLAALFVQTEVQGHVVRSGAGALLGRRQGRGRGGLSLPSLLLALAVRRAVRPLAVLSVDPRGGLTAAQRDLVRRVRDHAARSLYVGGDNDDEEEEQEEEEEEGMKPATSAHYDALALLRAIDPDRLPAFFPPIVRDMQALLDAQDAAQYYMDYVCETDRGTAARPEEEEEEEEDCLEKGADDDDDGGEPEVTVMRGFVGSGSTTAAVAAGSTSEATTTTMSEAPRSETTFVDNDDDKTITEPKAKIGSPTVEDVVE